MFKITLLSIGDLPKGPFSELGDEFKRRLGQFAHFEHRVVKHENDLLKSAPQGTFLMILEATGKPLTSKAFAKHLGQLVDQGQHLTVLLGGPFGLSDETKQQADLLLSLSPMTTTHDIAHIFFLEQLYRAFTIMKGKAYHY